MRDPVSGDLTAFEVSWAKVRKVVIGAGILLGVLDLAACSQSRGALRDGEAANASVAAMTRALLDDPQGSPVDDPAHVFVQVPIIEDVDGALQLQGNAMLTWPYRTEAGDEGRVRVLTVALNAVVLHHGYQSPHLVSAHFRINELECASRSTESLYLAADLTTLPIDGQEQFPDSVLAHPNRHYVVHLQPKADLTWGEVTGADQIDLKVESRPNRAHR